MLNLIQRKPHELSNKEKDQIKVLLKRYYPTANEEYISSRLSNKYGFDIVLLKYRGIVLGANYLKLDRLKTPFHHKKIWVVYFGQALKNEYYKGSVIWRAGHWYAKKNISSLYAVKRTVGLSVISTPKVFEHFTKLFKNHIPNLGSYEVGKSISITNFLRNTFGKRGVRLKFGSNCCFALLDFDPIDITEDWERHYKAKNEAINEFSASMWR
ncbi:MAG: hypothetical protein AAF361_10570 [Bacteroidota bacterium]